ncbi:hypothetical protein Tco_1452113 [Tanacetum coccineum]
MTERVERRRGLKKLKWKVRSQRRKSKNQRGRGGRPGILRHLPYHRRVSIKISCMVGQFLKEQAYIDLDSPINVISRLNYYWIMSGGNFTYECDFVIVKDTTSVIDRYLRGMVLGKPFVKETGFKHIDFEEIKTDCIPPFVIEGNDDDHEKAHYSYSLNLGHAYKRDESMTKAIKCLIKMKSRKAEG